MIVALGKPGALGHIGAGMDDGASRQKAVNEARVLLRDSTEPAGPAHIAFLASNLELVSTQENLYVSIDCRIRDGLPSHFKEMGRP